MQSLTKKLRCVYIPKGLLQQGLDGSSVSPFFQLPALIPLSLSLSVSLSLSWQLRLSLGRRTSLPRGPPLTAAPGTTARAAPTEPAQEC